MVSQSLLTASALAVVVLGLVTQTLLPTGLFDQLPNFYALLRIAAALGAGVKVVQLLLKQYIRFPGEPPLVSGPMPWLGLAAEFGKGSGIFLARMRKLNNGGAFTAFIAGRRMTFLPPSAYQAMFRQPKTLCFNTIMVHIGKACFGFQHGDPKAILQDPEVHRMFIQHLSGQGLLEMSSRFAPLFEEESCSRPLFELVQLLLVRAGLGSLWWRMSREEALALLADFNAFDKGFMLLAGGVPGFLMRKPTEARERLAQFATSGVAFEEDAKKQKSLSILKPMCDVVEARFRYFSSHWGLDAPQIASKQVALLYGAHSNTAPTAFWAMARLLHDPKALAAVSAEVRREVDVSKAEEVPLLESLLDEVLRFYGAMLSVREVTESTKFEWPGGSAWLRKGDRVVAASHYRHFEESTLGEDCEQFRFDRFCNNSEGAGSPPKASATTQPFGGGSSMCSGRHFAKVEMRLLVAGLLRSFDWEAIQQLPEADPSRTGMLQPLCDVTATFRRRAEA
ncbi:unnamed protein product [Polarella glacialis]|uniref:Cytochrome P450 n=1 Tax=Polarella glacialis TaxID=89957 RepID=A0A813CZF0_POLGL|nr:unnamed protein product [Polarella glacialis]